MRGVVFRDCGGVEMGREVVFSVDLVFKMRSSVYLVTPLPVPPQPLMWNNTHTTPLQCPPELIFYAEQDGLYAGEALHHKTLDKVCIQEGKGEN